MLVKLGRHTNYSSLYISSLMHTKYLKCDSLSRGYPSYVIRYTEKIQQHHSHIHLEVTCALCNFKPEIPKAEMVCLRRKKKPNSKNPNIFLCRWLKQMVSATFSVTETRCTMAIQSCKFFPICVVEITLKEISET